MVDFEIHRLRDIYGNRRALSFNCGVKDVNEFLKNNALKHHRRGQTVTFCGRKKVTGELLGYYCLSMDAHPVAEVPKNVRQNSHVQSAQAFPAVYMPFLGVSREWQRRKIGETLLMDAIHRTGTIAENIGYFGMTLRAISVQTREFYRKLGFVPYTNEDQFPVLMILPRRTIVEIRREALITPEP